METPQLLWTQGEWLAEASAWISAQVARLGLRQSGPIAQPHVRPWSTVLRVPTSGGELYFKASMPALGHEPALSQALAAWRPDLMLEVLAVDPQRGWMLQPEAGVMLRSLVSSTADLHHWRQILPLYAGLQIEMAARGAELLSLGILDRRLTSLAEQYEALLDERQSLRIDQPDGLSAGDYHRLVEFTPRLREMCAELAAWSIPETLHHDDFHDANIFVRDGRYLLSDWAESCLAHPFFTLLVTLRVIAYRLELEEFAPPILELRDVYLDAWLGYAPLAELRSAFRLAYPLAMVCRALTWQRVVSRLDEPYRSKHAEAVPGWLFDFLEAVSQPDEHLPPA